MENERIDLSSVYNSATKKAVKSAAEALAQWEHIEIPIRSVKLKRCRERRVGADIFLAGEQIITVPFESLFDVINVVRKIPVKDKFGSTEPQYLLHFSPQHICRARSPDLFSILISGLNSTETRKAEINYQ